MKFGSAGRQCTERVCRYGAVLVHLCTLVTYGVRYVPVGSAPYKYVQAGAGRMVAVWGC